MRAPLLHRIGALLCGTLYLPLGLVWAYGAALVVLPLAWLGLWLLREADRIEAAAGAIATPPQQRLRVIARWMLWTGLVASAVAFLATR